MDLAGFPYPIYCAMGLDLQLRNVVLSLAQPLEDPVALT